MSTMVDRDESRLWSGTRRKQYKARQMTDMITTWRRRALEVETR